MKIDGISYNIKACKKLSKKDFCAMLPDKKRAVKHYKIIKFLKNDDTGSDNKA